MSQRTERVDELLRQEIGALLSREVADPRIGFATITEVETAPDLRHARVWVSVIGQEAERRETLRALQKAMGFVRHELGRRLRIKRIPELHVRLDDSIERGSRVLHLLQELEAGNTPEDEPPAGESLPTPERAHLPAEPGAEGQAAPAPRPVRRRGGPGRPPAGPRPGGPRGGTGRGPAGRRPGRGR